MVKNKYKYKNLNFLNNCLLKKSTKAQNKLIKMWGNFANENKIYLVIIKILLNEILFKKIFIKFWKSKSWERSISNPLILKILNLIITMNKRINNKINLIFKFCFEKKYRIK